MRSLFDSILSTSAAILSNFKVPYPAQLVVLAINICLLPAVIFAQEKKEQLSNTPAKGASIQTAQKSKSQESDNNTRKPDNNIHLNKKQSNSFYINEIVLKNAKFLNRRVRKRLLAPYLHTRLNSKRIGKLVQNIRAYYIEKGYPTTQVKVVLGQNLKDGILQLVVNIGSIEEIILNDHQVRDKGKVATAFPCYRNRFLYLPYLEQGIDQINSVSSSKATLRILPGLREGGSVIQIDRVVNKPVRLEVGMDNLGEEDSGKWRWKYNVAIDNLLSINDNLTVHYNINQAKMIQGTKLRDHSFMVKFSFPIGYFNFFTTHNIRSSIKPIKSTNYLDFNKNKTVSHDYEVRFAMYKHRINKGTFFVDLINTEKNSHFRDVLIHSQSGIQTQLKIGTNHTGLILGGQYMLDVAYEQGVDWFGAKQTTQETAHMPKQQLKKVNCHFTWICPFVLFKKLSNYRFDCSGQYAKNELESTHQLNITDSGHVRGFGEKYAVGNKGICFKQELSLHHLFSFSRWLLPLELQAGIDVGYLPEVSSVKPKLKKLPCTVMSFAVGCHYNIRWFNFDLSYAKPLYSSEHLTIQKDTYQIIFNLTCKLHEFLSK